MKRKANPFIKQLKRNRKAKIKYNTLIMHQDEYVLVNRRLDTSNAVSVGEYLMGIGWLQDVGGTQAVMPEMGSM